MKLQTGRQYELQACAIELGWQQDQVIVIDEDLGSSASGRVNREGFEGLVSEVALGRAGIVLGLEVSRLARNNRDWYGLLDLCAMKGTLIGDAEGVYDPSTYNDRLLLGLKGTMSEAELHLIKGRMLAGLRHKAAKGELKFTLPAGYEFDDSGHIVKTSDEQIRHFIELLFSRMLEHQSVSGVYKDLMHEGLRVPRRERSDGSIRWEVPYYRAVYLMLVNPIYAGTYAWGRTAVVVDIGANGARRTRQRPKPVAEWDVVIHDHHPAYVSRDNFERIEQMIQRNRPAPRDEAASALREGSALLQGIVRCGRCGRSMKVRYHGRFNGGVNLSYACAAARAGRGSPTCQYMGGRRIDAAVAHSFLEVMSEGQVEIHLAALRKLDEREDAVLDQIRLQMERAEYEAGRLERQYNAVEPENRVVARTLENRWNEALGRVEELRQRFEQRRAQLDARLTTDEEARLGRLTKDLAALWANKSVTDRDRKALLRAVIEEVQLLKQERSVDLKIIWKGGTVTESTVALQRIGRKGPLQPDVVELVRQLATRYSDAQIARVLIRRGIKTPRTKASITARIVADLRRRYDIPACTPEANNEGATYTVEQAAKLFRVSPPTIYSWLKAGVLVGEQLTHSAPWSITVTDADRQRLGEEAPEGWKPIDQAAEELAVSKQTILNWVKARKIPYVFATRGRRRGLRIDVNSAPQRRQGRLLD